MEAEIEKIGKILLDAPVGYVEETISGIITKPVSLKVVEQNSLSGTRYVRKVIIGYDKFPILRAKVTFDSQNIPKPVMTSLLQKRDSIGNILRNNKIHSERRPIKIDFDQGKKTVTREYQIVCNDSIWFDVSEEIRLDLLRACKNG